MKRSFMKIKQGLKSLNIMTDNLQIYYSLQNLIEKNFKKSIGKKNKIIIFADDDELHQRKYLLKFIAKFYEQHNPKAKERFLKIIKNSYEKSLKLTLIKENELIANVNIKISFKQDILLKLESSNKLLVSYLLNYFSGTKADYIQAKNHIKITPKDKDFMQKFENLLQKKEHLNWNIEFSYNKIELENYKAAFLSPKKTRQFNALENLLEEYFEICGCKKGDSFSMVRQSYLTLAKIYHPDRHQSSSFKMQEYYRQKFEHLKLAYELIKSYFEKNNNSYQTA